MTRRIRHSSKGKGNPSSKIVPNGGDTFRTSAFYLNEAKLKSMLSTLSAYANYMISDLPPEAVTTYNELVNFIKEWEGSKDTSVRGIVAGTFNGNYAIGTLGSSLSECKPKDGVPGACTLECLDSVFSPDTKCEYTILTSDGEVLKVEHDAKTTHALLMTKVTPCRDIYTQIKSLGITHVKIIKIDKNGKYIVGKEFVVVDNKVMVINNGWVWVVSVVIIILLLAGLGIGGYYVLKKD